MSYRLIKRGKIRELYIDEVSPSQVKIITTDNISIYNVVLPFKVTGKGKLLTRITKYWSNYLQKIAKFALLSSDHPEDNILISRRLEMLDYEFVVRHYLPKKREEEMLNYRTIDGIPVDTELIFSKPLSRLERPVLSYYIKGEDTDQPISFENLAKYVDRKILEEASDISLDLFELASARYRECGFVLVDTKFEFGMFEEEIYVGDEVLTPDSSRIIEIGKDLKHFDKELMRAYYANIDASHYQTHIPNNDVIQELIERYRQVENRLIQKSQNSDMPKTV